VQHEMGAESTLLPPQGEELIKWKQCYGGGGVCVCVRDTERFPTHGEETLP